MRALWDLSKTKGIPVSIDWSFLEWTSQSYVDENSELQDVKFESSVYGFVNDTAFRKLDVSYEDRVTFSDGTLEYSIFGSALDDLSDKDSALITAIVFSDRVTNSSWTLAFENEQTKLPIRSPYVVDEFASPSLSYLTETIAISNGDLSSLTDRVYGSARADFIEGGLAADYIKGAGGNDTLIGGNGRDQLFGLDGDDLILGGRKDDLLHGDAGNDTLIGGRGNDRLSAGYDWDNNNDLLRGGLGDDFLWTDIGSDTLSGGAGDDEIIANSDDPTAARVLRGGDGNDTLYNAGSHLSIMRGNDGDDHLVSSDTRGEALAYMYGGAGNDTVKSSAHQGSLFGGEGNDKVVSWNGNELVSGGAGDDTIRGGKGNDTLRGGSGDDLLFGGQGRDAFVFTQGGGADEIRDYKIGTDVLRIQSNLVGGMTDVSEVLKTYFETNSNDELVVAFDDGSSVTLVGLSEGALNQLAADIEIF